MEFIIENLGTIIVAVLLLITVGFAIRSMVMDRKNGKMCSGCSGCSGGSNCRCDDKKNNSVKKKRL